MSNFTLPMMVQNVNKTEIIDDYKPLKSILTPHLIDNDWIWQRETGGLLGYAEYTQTINEDGLTETIDKVCLIYSNGARINIDSKHHKPYLERIDNPGEMFASLEDDEEYTTTRCPTDLVSLYAM